MGEDIQQPRGMAIDATLSHNPREERISIPEAANILGVEAKLVRKLLDNGAFPYEKPSCHRRIKRGDVLDYRSGRRWKGQRRFKSPAEDSLA
jgi:excisionase family DNA binding protein